MRTANTLYVLCSFLTQTNPVVRFLLSLGLKKLITGVPIKKLKFKTNKTIILPVVLYGCETWSLTLREEERLSVLENKVLRKMFWTK